MNKMILAILIASTFNAISAEAAQIADGTYEKCVGGRVVKYTFKDGDCIKTEVTNEVCTEA